MQLVGERRDELTVRAITDQPAWLAAMGAPPTHPTGYTQWLGHVGVVAAYRDQHQVTLDRADQPLGPYVSAGSSRHEAYLHAANAILIARHPNLTAVDTITARITADAFLAQPDHTREAITTAVAAIVGPDWLGPRHGDADTLITAPAYAAHLRAELVHRGLLNPPRTALIRPPAPPAQPPVRPQPPLLQPPMEYHQPQPGIGITW
jgi:hypothetical protein